MLKLQKKVVIPGGAGLVGQNLVTQFVEAGFNNLVVLDKHQHNLNILKQLHPNVIVECVDIAVPGDWENHFDNADVVVMLQAQIGGNNLLDFEQNNVVASKNVISAMKERDISRLIHVSSSVVESVANDWYTTTKKQQEELALTSGLSVVTLRPTLMFGWFDRKHLGWLSRFMKRSPVFPIPGDGRYMRQPLYAGDFCQIILSCVQSEEIIGIYNISGHEKIDYVDIIESIKRVTRARSKIVHIPVTLFKFLLQLWSIWDKDPPFTSQQLTALIAHDEFEIIDWPKIFSVTPTPLSEALDKTFNDAVYSRIVLDF
jgi:nucleoside-diphosphate-sugar epimerase